ncbi:unnamed protein product [Lasius platythorax]|uniref:Uncharacterized protein n=1 Tax=Lasius platythorax TaxID=488582 RepID=A0AAV2NBV9_9HYME
MPGVLAKRTEAELSVTCPTGSFPPAVMRERAAVVHLACSPLVAPYITGLINAESSPMPRTGSCKMLPREV